MNIKNLIGNTTSVPSIDFNQVVKCDNLRYWRISKATWEKDKVELHITFEKDGIQSSYDKKFDTIMEAGFYSIVCEDLQARYGEIRIPEGSVKVGDDGYGFYDYKWNGHTFGVFGNYGKYNRSDIIITPLGNFCDWEKYCKAVKNNELVRRNNHIDDDKIVH